MSIELLIAAAKTFNEDQILNDVLESVKEYRITKSQDSKHKMMLHISLAHIKFSSENMSIGETLKYVDEKSKAIKFFETNKQ